MHQFCSYLEVYFLHSTCKVRCGAAAGEDAIGVLILGHGATSGADALDVLGQACPGAASGEDTFAVLGQS